MGSLPSFFPRLSVVVEPAGYSSPASRPRVPRGQGCGSCGSGRRSWAAGSVVLWAPWWPRVPRRPWHLLVKPYLKRGGVTVIHSGPAYYVLRERETRRCGGRELAAGGSAGRCASRGPDPAPRALLRRGTSQSWLCRIEPVKGTYLGGG